MGGHNHPSIELWKLLVGGNDHYLSPIILSRMADFRGRNSAASLFATALKARPMSGALKEESLALWLIDQLRIGVGWREDLEDLNASFCDSLKHIEILQDGISSTTLLMALLECFDPSEVSVRCTLLHMAARCALPVPVGAHAHWLLPEVVTPAPTLLYIGGLAYTVPPAEHNRMVLLLSTTSVTESRRDVLLRNLFRLDERLQARIQDSLNEYMIELFVNTPLVKDASTGSTRTCQLLISNGCWDHHRQYIHALAKVASAIVLSLTGADIAADGSLYDVALQQLVANNEGRLICVFNRGSSGRPRVSDWKQMSDLRMKQNVEDEDCFLLPENLARTTPDLINAFQLISKAMWKMVDHARGENGVPVHWLDMQGHLPSLYQQEWMKLCNFAAEVRKGLDMKVDQGESKRDLRHQMFPFSQAAHNAAVERNKRAAELRCKDDAGAGASGLLVEIEDQERADFTKAANATPHPFFLFFLSHVMSPQDMYFFEREVEVWKSTGAVSDLQIHLENTKKKLDKAMEQHRDVEQLKNDVEKIYAQLDAVDWSTPDFWREIRTIKGLPQRHLLSPYYITKIREKYESIFMPTEKQESMARSFLGLFLRGMTVDVLDGNLLSVDKDFLHEVFTPLLYQDSISSSEDASESYFVISMLGVQSTGKSTLLNNLFGCTMPVSVGRTTRGMNVCRVQVNLPNSSIKHIIVQDYEGLMTMDRTDSLFDKDVCLQALATSDLVLVNTSKVIDAPTQQLLQYAAFAFHEMGLQKYRELKPKLAFVLRDMVSADTSTMAPAKRAMETAILNGFIETLKMSSNLQLSDVMEVPEYIALASAVHRRDPFWQESLLSLRQFIFTAITDLAKDASQSRSFKYWVASTVASWDCIRTNTGLLVAKTLAELRLKNMMEAALHAALKSEGTVTKSETRVKGIIDSILNSTKGLEEQEVQFKNELEVEFNLCLGLVIREFEAKAGGEETIPEALKETWQDFRNHRIEKEVRRKAEHLKLLWSERFQIKRTEVSMHAAVGTLIGKICAETPSSNKLNKTEAAKRFEDLWKPEESKFKSLVNKQYAEEEIKRKVDGIFVLVCMKRFNDQPNDYLDLIDMEKGDLTEDFTKMDLSFRTIARSIVQHFLNPFGRRENNRTEKSDKDVITDIRNQLSGAILSFNMSLSSLHNDIETAVIEINTMIRRASHDFASAKLDAWTSQLAKAAHRHLYRDVVRRVASLSRQAKEEQLKNFMERGSDLKDNYVARITGMLEDRDLYGQITTKLSDALLKMAVDPARLGLRPDDVSGPLLSHFSAISSPEMVEEICYDNLFMRENDDLLFEYIKYRSATTKSTWNEYYEMGERAIRNSSYEQMDMFFLKPGCDFERLKAATEAWFRQNNEKKKEPVANLVNQLSEEFEFLRSDDRLMVLTISTIEEVSPSLMLMSWPEASTMISEGKRAIDSYVDALRGPITNITYGCSELCPYCGTKCKHSADHVVSHECHRHLVTGFKGAHRVRNRRLATQYCTGDAFNARWALDSDENDGSFYESIALVNKDMSPGWKIEREGANLPPIEQREAFKRLNKRIASHFGLVEANELWCSSAPN